MYYVHTHTHTHTHTQVHTHKPTHAFAHTHTHTHTPTHALTHTHTHTLTAYSYIHSIIYTNEKAPGPCTLDITALFKEFTTSSVVEATPDFLEMPHTGSAALNCKEASEECEKGKRNKFLIELYPLQLKTLILTLS